MRRKICLQSGEKVLVTAQPIKLRIAPEREFFVHREYRGAGKPPRNGRWGVTELTTGAAIAFANGPLAATRRATVRLRKEGLARMEEQIAMWIDKFGVCNHNRKGRAYDTTNASAA